MKAAERPNWHLGHLDSLRGWAVLGVVLVHTALDCGVPAPWDERARIGQRGVQLFFLISAFTLFLSGEQRRRAEAHPVRNFFLRRIFRLTPMYYVAIALSALLHPEVLGGGKDLLLGFVYMQWISPDAILHVAPGAWTVSVEAMFYLCLPLLFRWVRTLGQAVAWFAGAAVVLSSVSVVLARAQPRNYQYFSFLWFPIELPVFLMGIVVYFVWRRYLAGGWQRDQRRVGMLAGALYAASFLVLLLTSSGQNRSLYLASLGCALLLLAVLVRPWGVLVNRATIFLGRISYSVYLLHGFVLLAVLAVAGRNPYLVQHAGARFGCVLVSTMAGTALCASVTWLYVEDLGIRLGRRFIARLEHRAARGEATALPVPAAELTSLSNSPDSQF